MSVAKPMLEYIETIKVRADIRGSIEAFRRLLKYHKPYLHFFIAILAMAVLRSYFFILEPIYTSQVIDNVINGGQHSLLEPLVLNIFLAVVAFAITDLVIKYLNGYAAQRIIRDIRREYYVSTQSKSFTFFDSNAVGDLVSRATMDTQAIDMFLRTHFSVAAHAVFSIALIIPIMYTVSPIMTLIALLPMPFIFYFNAKLWTNSMLLFRKMQLILGKLGSYVQQDILGMKNIRIFRREGEMDEGFKKIEDTYVDTAIMAGKVQAMYTSAPQAILTLGIVVAYIYGANLYLGSILTIGGIALFARFMMRIAFPLRDFSQTLGTWTNASAGLERIYEIIDRPGDVKNNADARNVTIERGEVEFKDVTFSYVQGQPVLKNISFKARPSEKIAILGATGSGKTSLIYLIPRFYDVDSGNILIDDVDVRSFDSSFLRRQIGLVLQDVYLFSGTIRSNTAFGKPDAPIDEVIAAAKLARIHDFIATLPQGYDALVGERGVTLSGGQRQRLTIARALLTKPKILIFDDSLSFVDAKTEQEIQTALDEATKARTCFIIAQRLSTIKNADKIMVLDNGRIAEFGTHSELMASGNIYRKIYETQFLEKAPEEILQSK